MMRYFRCPCHVKSGMGHKHTRGWQPRARWRWSSQDQGPGPGPGGAAAWYFVIMEGAQGRDQRLGRIGCYREH